ncbi:MAG: hypothetical protein NZ700_09205 [Gemmataceae bacterium]|nr:hypothetical protein [Gemmataceae bacterium]MDW8264177.1 hypothetical protein [Gemmataceae bacterium]
MRALRYVCPVLVAVVWLVVDGVAGWGQGVRIQMAPPAGLKANNPVGNNGMVLAAPGLNNGLAFPAPGAPPGLTGPVNGLNRQPLTLHRRRLMPATALGTNGVILPNTFPRLGLNPFSVTLPYLPVSMGVNNLTFPSGRYDFPVGFGGFPPGYGLPMATVLPAEYEAFTPFQNLDLESYPFPANLGGLAFPVGLGALPVGVPVPIPVPVPVPVPVNPALFPGFWGFGMPALGGGVPVGNPGGGFAAGN